MADVMRDPSRECSNIHPWVAEGQRAVRFGIVGGPSGVWSALRDFVQRVEDLGFDAYWRPDHPLFLPDCWTNLAAGATVTHRVRPGSLVGCVSSATR